MTYFVFAIQLNCNVCNVMPNIKCNNFSYIYYAIGFDTEGEIAVRPQPSSADQPVDVKPKYKGRAEPEPSATASGNA